MAGTDIIYMNVGDIRTLSFSAPPYIVGTQWTISDWDAVTFTTTPGSRSTSATIKALNARPASDRCIVHCTYYYRELDPSGRYEYQRTGYQDWEIIIRENGSGGGGETGPTVTMHMSKLDLDEGSGLTVLAYVSDDSYSGNFKWTTSDPTILKIYNERGPAVSVSGLSGGDASLRVTLDNGNYDEIPVHIRSKNSDISRLKFTLTDDGRGYTVSAKEHDASIYGDIVIPETYNNKPVTEISEKGFWDCDYLTSIVIPNSVIKIGANAFFSCKALRSISLGNSVISIGAYAFQGCESLTTITIPKTVTYIAPNLFSGCARLAIISIPESVTSIDNSAFAYCSNLTSINIPSSVISIGSSVFHGCSSLTSVSIGESVSSIGDETFEGCTSLKELIIEDGKGILSLGNNHYNGLFNDCPLEIVYLGRDLLYKTDVASGMSPFYGKETLTDLKIGEGVTSIGRYSFIHCKQLTSLTIPPSVITIGPSSFFGCESLKTLYLNAENWVGNGDYQSPFPSTLKELYLGDKVKSIPSDAFRTCSSLEMVTFGKSITTIGDGAFFYCSGLTSVTIPPTVISIGRASFSGCTGLTSITIPNSVESISSSAFHGCTSLISIYYETNDPIDGNSDIFSDYSPTLYVPQAAIEKCRQIDPWKNFQKIIEVDENEEPVYKDYLYVVGTLNNWDLDDLTYSLNKDDDGSYHGSIYFEKAANHEFILAYKNGDKTSFFHTSDNQPIIEETSINEDYIRLIYGKSLTTSDQYNLALPSNWPGGTIDIEVTNLDPDNRCYAILNIERSNMDGIESVVYDVEEEPVYFNLQGVNVGNNASVLSPGLYIKHQGAKIEKVFIK